MLILDTLLLLLFLDLLQKPLVCLLSFLVVDLLLLIEEWVLLANHESGRRRNALSLIGKDHEHVLLVLLLR